MVAAVPAPAAAPVVSVLAPCGYCAAPTSFTCLNCDGPMCPGCVRGDTCLNCRPAPANIVHFTDWATERQGYTADVELAECAGCGRMVAAVDNAPETFCPVCTLDTPRDPGCRMCGAPTVDGLRCALHAAFIARLDARWNARKEERLAA
jgi:hypothetical protein